MWVVQGVKLSPRHIVKCGAKEVDLDKLVELKCLWNDTLKKRRISPLIFVCSIGFCTVVCSPETPKTESL
jgi:hypothetical protein